MLASPGLQSYERVVVTRKPPADQVIKGIAYCPYDKDVIKSHFTGDYGIVNLAGASIGSWLWTTKRRAEILDSRVKVAGLISGLVEEALTKPRFIIQASAVGYYGSRGEEELTEDSGKGTGFLPDVTEAWEGAMRPFPGLNTRVIYLRTGLVLTASGGFLGPSLLFFRFFLGGHFGNGRQWMPWIHIRDEVDAIVFLMESESARGAYNLVSPNPVRGKYFYKMLGKSLKKPSWLPVPAFLIAMIPYGFGRELLLTCQNVKPKKLLEAGYRFRFEDLVNALDNIFGNE